MFVGLPTVTGSGVAMKLVIVGMPELADFTYRDVVDWTMLPLVPLMETVMLKVPICVGMQPNWLAFRDVHPKGSPLYEYMRGREPPDVVTVNVVEDPTVIVAGEALKDVIARGAGLRGIWAK
jgi:hypothetical protein